MQKLERETLVHHHIETHGGNPGLLVSNVSLFLNLPGDPWDAGTWAGLRAAWADVWLQTHEEAASEAPDGPGEQAEGGDGWTPAEVGQRAGEPEEQLHPGDGEAPEKASDSSGQRRMWKRKDTNKVSLPCSVCVEILQGKAHFPTLHICLLK